MQQQMRGHINLNAALNTKAGKFFGDLGVPMISHNGIPVIHDADCTTGVVYALSAEAIKWIPVTGGDHTMMGDGFEQTMITGVMGSLAYLRVEGQLCVFERRALGQVDAITAA
jgi:hypothetical protein